MWTLYDFSTVREIEGKKLMSSKTQYVSNCEEDEQRILYVVAYTESMGEGEVLESGNPGEWWIPIVPGSIDELLWKFACGK